VIQGKIKARYGVDGPATAYAYRARSPDLGGGRMLPAAPAGTKIRLSPNRAADPLMPSSG